MTAPDHNSPPHASRSGTPEPAVRPAADVFEGEHEFRVVLDLPGVAAGDLEVTSEGATLSVAARRPPGAADPLHYQRSFTLPSSVEPTGIQARLTDGVLTLTLPKRETAKRRRIDVRAA